MNQDIALLNLVARLGALPHLDADQVAAVFDGRPMATTTNPYWNTVELDLPGIRLQSLRNEQPAWWVRAATLARRWPFTGRPRHEPTPELDPPPLALAVELRLKPQASRSARLVCKINPAARLARGAIAPRLGLGLAPHKVFLSWFKARPLVGQDLLFSPHNTTLKLSWTESKADLHWYLTELEVDATGNRDEQIDAAPRHRIHVGPPDGGVELSVPEVGPILARLHES